MQRKKYHHPSLFFSFSSFIPNLFRNFATVFRKDSYYKNLIEKDIYMENRTWKSVKSTIMPICIISIICILLICSKILLLEVFGTIGLIFIIIAVGCVLYYDLSPKEQRKQREIDESIKRDRLERINSIRDKKAKLDLEIESYSTKYGKLTRKILYTSNYDGLFVVQCNNLKVFDSYDEEGQKQDFISYDEFDY